MTFFAAPCFGRNLDLVSDQDAEDHDGRKHDQAEHRQVAPAHPVYEDFLAHGCLLMLGRAVDQVIYDPPQRF